MLKTMFGPISKIVPVDSHCNWILFDKGVHQQLLPVFVRSRRNQQPLKNYVGQRNNGNYGKKKKSKGKAVEMNEFCSYYYDN